VRPEPYLLLICVNTAREGFMTKISVRLRIPLNPNYVMAPGEFQMFRTATLEERRGRVIYYTGRPEKSAFKVSGLPAGHTPNGRFPGLFRPSAPAQNNH
jgi:hypothetical protein